MGPLKRKSQRILNHARDGAYSDLFDAVHDNQIDLCFHGLATDPPEIGSIQVNQIDPLAYDSATLDDGFVLVNYGRFSCGSEQWGPGFNADGDDFGHSWQSDKEVRSISYGVKQVQELFGVASGFD